MGHRTPACALFITQLGGTAIMAKGKQDDFITGLYEDAVTLKAEKDDVLKRIGANRDILRTLITAGKLDDEGVTFVNDMYPPRKTKDGEDEDGNGDDTPPEDAVTDAEPTPDAE